MIEYASLPYIWDRTPKLYKVIEDENPKKVNRSCTTVKTIFSQLKDSTPKLDKSNVMYNIPCEECNLNYVGQTSRNLKGRITSHRSDNKLEPNSSALSIHHNNPSSENALIKILMIVNHGETLKNINVNINQFWTTKKFTAHLEHRLEDIFTTVKTMLFCYRWFAIMTSTMIVPLKPIFLGNKELPVDIWQPVNLLVTPYYEITYFLESCVTYFASLVNIAIDSIYAGYIVHIIAQGMLLKHAFRNIPLKHVTTSEEETVCWTDMKNYIEYHNHLLNVIDNIQKTHSFLFLNVVVTGTMSVCIDLYSVAVDNGSLDVMRLVKYTFQCSFFVFLLLTYCFTGNELTHQYLGLSDAIYESEWYHGSLPRVRRGVILVIQKAQKHIYLNAGGLLTLDLVNFVKMLRLAFSVFTLIRAKAEQGN